MSEPTGLSGSIGVVCWRCGQPIDFGTDDGSTYLSNPPQYAHAKCPPKPGKCPQCGFMEHASDESCPVVTGKLYGHTRMKGVFTEEQKNNMTAAPSLVLTVVDFGDGCIVKCEQGDFNQIDAAALLVTGSTCMDNVAITSHSFLELQKSIDEHFAESKPVPRIEKNPDNDGYKFIVSDMADSWLLPAELKAINELARAAGATKDLPIYEPKGTWTRLNTHDWTAARQSASEAGYGIDTHSYEDAICPVKIWRYEY